MDVLTVKVQSTGVSQTTTELNKLGTAADNTERKVLKLIETVNSMAKQFSAGAAGTKALTEALNASQRTTKASDVALQSLANSIGESAAASKALVASVSLLGKELAVLNGRLQQGSTAVKQSTVNIVHHTAAMNEAHSAARGLTGSLGALWLTYGNVAPLAAGAAIGASLKAIVTIGADVQNTLTAIQIKTDATTEQMQELGKAISDLGKGIYGPQEVAKALETLSLAGLNASQAATAVGAALNLATSGGTTIEKSAEALVTIGTAVGATANEYDYLADAIQKTANVSLASVDSIAETVKRASVVNQLYGASFEDILTQAAALAQLGIKNSAAGTAITNFYANAMASTDKAKKALDALGFSFQDATGKAKPLVQAFTEFQEKLNKFDLGSQRKLITEVFGERALRDVQAQLTLINQQAESTERLADGTLKYKNRLEELNAEVKNSAGTAAILAAEQSLTIENQAKSTANTLKSVFANAFTEVSPAIDNILRKLRELFESSDFQTAITNIAKGFASLAETIANNIGPLAAMAEGFLVIGTITAGGAIFTRLVPVIQGLIVVTTGLATSLTSAGAAAQIGAVGLTAFSNAARFLPGIGIALGVLTAAYALYTIHSDKATKSTQDFAEETKKAADQSGMDFLKSLDAQIDRLKKVNAELDKGKTLQDANNKANQEAAIARQRQPFVDAETAAQTNLNSAVKDKLLNAGDFINQKSYADKVVQAQQMLNDAKKATVAFDAEITKKLKEQEDLTQAQSDKINARTKAAEEAAKNAAGNKTFNPDAEQAAKKQLSFIEEEQRQLKLLAAGYQARGDALLKSYLAGEKIAADTQQARIRVNQAEKKYTSEQIVQQQLALARTADEKKDYEERVKQFTELGAKIRQINEGERAAQEAFGKTGKDKGNLERQISDLTDYLKVQEGSIKLTERQAEVSIEEAMAADLVNRAIEYRKKLESDTKSAGGRADALVAQAEAMAEYGSKVKSTALDLAKGKVAQEEFTDSITKGAQAAYIASAAYETAAKAFSNITKIGAQSSEDFDKAQADSLLIFADSEKKKVQIKADAAKKIIASNLAQAKSAAETGDAKAIDTYEKAKLASIDAIAQIDRTTTLKTHNIELEDWKKTANGIADATLESFERSRSEGLSIWKSFTNSLKDLFKKTIFDYIKKEFAKPIVLNLVASVAGGLGLNSLAESASKSAGEGSDLISKVSSVKSVFDLLNKGFDGIASKISSVASKLGFSEGTASSIGAAGANVAGIAGGIYGGRALSGGYAISGSGNGLVNAGTAIGGIAAVLGGPLGIAASSLIGGLVGGALNRLFGRGPKEIQSQGIRGTIDDMGTTGQSYQNWKQKGGLFRSSKSGTDTQALTADLTNTLTSGFTQIKAVSEGFANTLGISSGALDGFSKKFDIAFGTDAQKNQEAVTKFFTDLGDEFAVKLIPNIAEFARQGETAGQTLERLSNVFAATNQIADILGKSAEKLFGGIGLSSDKARERLVDLAGGIDKLTSKAAAYASEFLTDAEKLAPVQRAVNEALKSLGVSGVYTKEQFKDLVNSLDLTNEAQAKLFNSLLDLAPAFAQVANATESAIEKLKEAQREAEELARMNVDKAFSDLQKSVDAQKKLVNSRYEAEVAQIKAVGEAQKAAAQKQLQSAKDYLSALEKVSSSIGNALKSTEISSPAIDKARRESAQQYLASLSGKDLTKAAGLDNALSAVSGESQQFFSSFEDFARDQAKTANILNGLKNQNDISRNFAELTVARLNDTIDAIEKSTDAQLLAAQKRHEDEIASLDKIIENAQSQIDVLNGINITLLTIPQALQGLAAAIAALKATQAVGGSPISVGPNGNVSFDPAAGINSLYQQLLGRNAEESAIKNWSAWQAGGGSLQDLANSILNSDEYKNIHKFDVGTNNVPSDMLAMVHKGERIIPAADNAELMRRLDNEEKSKSGSTEVKEMLKTLIEITQIGDSANVAQSREIMKILRKFDQEGLPETRDTELS